MNKGISKKQEAKPKIMTREGPMMLYRGLSRTVAPTLSYQITERLRILEILSSISGNVVGKHDESEISKPGYDPVIRRDCHTVVTPKIKLSVKRIMREGNCSADPASFVRLNRSTDYIWHPVKPCIKLNRKIH